MRVLVTGSSGLIGSEVVSHFAAEAHEIHGMDNNMRAAFFGLQGDTRGNQKRLCECFPSFKHHEMDIRDRRAIERCLKVLRPDLIVHTAAQPSHDFAASNPFTDFDINAVGTFNLLEATRKHAPEAVFVHMSTNKVYGDAPNEIQMIELDTRFDYFVDYQDGIAEDFRIDQSKHSLFGASKVAADIMVQEYGRYFGMKTCCLRAGCLTGPNHSGVELHGFLSYLIKTNLEGQVYRIFGYKGKQVRDNLHSLDVARFISEFVANPRCGEVYNIGGGRDNSCSILMAFQMVEEITGKPMLSEYVDKHREGDHICYISNLKKIQDHYPVWDVSIPLHQIFEEIAQAWRADVQQS